MGQIEIKGINDRLTIISILAKNGYLVRQRRLDQTVNGKRTSTSVVEFEKPEDPFVSTARRDDE